MRAICGVSLALEQEIKLSVPPGTFRRSQRDVARLSTMLGWRFFVSRQKKGRFIKYIDILEIDKKRNIDFDISVFDSVL